MGSFGQFYFQLTHKQLEAQRFIISTVPTDALVLKHQVISIHSADYIMHCSGPVHQRKKLWIIKSNIRN